MPAFFRELTVGRRRFAVVAVLLLCVEIGVSTYHRTRKVGDFDALRMFGGQLLRGEELYAEGAAVCYNYMPITALYYLPTALTPSWAAALWRSLLAVGCLALTIRWLLRMTAGTTPRSVNAVFDLAAWSLLLAGHYIFRDFDDAGPHVILLAMLVGGLYCVWQSRERLAAAWFGLAIALKMTPGLLLPFFVWKRQFRLAAMTAVATAAWIALPMVWMGPQAWWTAQWKWASVALRAASGNADVNEARIANQALRPALDRLLVAYPPGDARKLDHPLDVPVLNLEPATARRITGAALLALLAVCAWRTRRAYDSPHDPARLSEFAGVLLLMTLASPVTWLQHLPWVLPSAWLLVERYREAGGRDRVLRIGLGLYLFMALGLNRELLGRQTYYLLLSWHMHTICQLLLLGLLTATRGRTAAAVAAPEQAELPVRRAA